MPHPEQVDLDRDRSAFVSTIVASPGFRSRGYACGRSGSVWWAVVDPRAHPLRVWRKSGRGIASYSATATSLGAVVFTNGPMMGKRLGPGRKLGKGLVAWEFARWAGLGIAAGASIATDRRARVILGLCGAIAGIALASKRVFANWIPCGTVVGAEAGIHDGRDFDGEGRTHAWFGRFSRDFASYCIAAGDLPAGVVEGVGGLILLVQDFAPVSASPGAPAFHRDFAALSHKQGVVAWGLVPLDHVDAERPDGVIVVIGGRRGLDARAAADHFCALGARAAVALDQSGSVMLGTGASMLIGPPPIHRQSMQLYGLYCA